MPGDREYSVLQIVGVVGIAINSARGRGQPGQMLSLCFRLRSLDSFYNFMQTLMVFGQINYLRFRGLELYKGWNKGGQDWNYTIERAAEKRLTMVMAVTIEMERSGEAGYRGKVIA